MEKVLIVIDPQSDELIHAGQPETFDEKQLLHYALTGFTIKTITIDEFRGKGYKLYEKIPGL